MDVRFIDTTFRDGSLSLWAYNMRAGMIAAVAESMDQAGFDAIEVPVNPIPVKKFVRELKEDPWEMMRMVARKMPNTVKNCMGTGNINTLGGTSPRALTKLYYECVVATGAMNRFQMVANTTGQIDNEFPWTFPLFRNLGVQIAVALSYTVSPRHTDEYYAQKTREVAALKPDVIYLKDQGGLLTPDRLRTLLPVIVQNANGAPVELHSHCMTGLAPLVYLEALQMGVRTLHTAVPPLANGSSQPSVFNVAGNARHMGHATGVDEKILRSVSERLTTIAKREKLPIGAPLEYDYAQYIHQVPGGVISNLKHQLIGMRMQDRLDEVLEESVQVRRDLGYPINITPYSQFLVTQSTLNVAMGERYKHVIDELILFAQGIYGEDSGYTWMDQNLKDKLLGMPRAKDLAARQEKDITLKEIRGKLGGPGVSDEEFLLRYIMKGGEEIEAMRAAGPPKQYFNAAMPLLTLIQELDKHRQVRYVQVQRGSDLVVIQNRSLV